MTRQSVAVVFPSFLGGGAEAVCAWSLEALRHEYDLTLITLSDIDVARLNSEFGTAMPADEVRVEHPIGSESVRRKLAASLSGFTLRQQLVSRYVKAHRDDHDLVFCAFNEMDLGGPGLLYVHFPMFGGGSEEARAIVGHPSSPMRRLYAETMRRLVGRHSQQRMLRHTFLANSHWVRDILSDLYGVEARVVYPPVAAVFPDVPWRDRSDGFVVVGRLVPEKRTHLSIEILEKVRQQGHDVHLHIVYSYAEPDTERLVMSLAAERSWVTLHRAASADELSSLLSRHRFGLHLRVNEQFGIAVAEMVKAGCIPFVPSSGGHLEITGNHNALTFDDVPTASRSISEVLRDVSTQDALRASLSERAHEFDPPQFVAAIQQVCSAALELR